METIEIKQNRKLTVIFVVILTAALFAMTIYVFFTDSYQNDLQTKLVYAVLNAVLLYTIYNQLKKLKDRTAIISINPDAISIHEGLKPVRIEKKDIQSITVEYISENGYFLIIETEAKTHKINITWLDKSSEEIKQLVKNYI
jgi:hypothetical protein